MKSIKDESGSLEAGYHNLHSLKELVETVLSFLDVQDQEVSRLYIVLIVVFSYTNVCTCLPRQEEALRNPWRLLEGILGPQSDLANIDDR